MLCTYHGNKRCGIENEDSECCDDLTEGSIHGDVCRHPSHNFGSTLRKRSKIITWCYTAFLMSRVNRQHSRRVSCLVTSKLINVRLMVD